MDYGILGGVRVLRAGAPISLGGPMAHRLLAALLVDAPGAVDRDTLVERLWGSSPPATAATALHVHVSRLRRALEPGNRAGSASSVRTTGDGYALAIEPTRIDAGHFESLMHRAGELAVVEPQRALGDVESARALWRGRPWGALADEPWLRGDAARLEELARRAEELWADLQLALGRHGVIVDSLRVAVEEEPLREHRWQQLMVALYRCDRQADALRAFQDARHTLTEELGIEPSPALRALEQAVLVQDPSLEAPPQVVPERPRHNLPAALTSLIGRSDDAALTKKLLEASRLVTITGSGGSGKTRLAIAVGEELVDRYDDGVWFVDLAAVSSAELVMTQIAWDLGLREGAEHGPQDPLTLLNTYLRHRQLLLVLDNCEHVVAEVATVVTALFTSCPGIRALATSRVKVGVVGESVQSLAPLDTPTVDATLEEVASSSAVRLFLQRAHDADASYDLSSEQLNAVGELCRFLEGLPLAIELAAMWIPTLAPSEILERLASRLSLATTDETLPERQRALRTTIEWSHALLADAERLAFRRLSVFPAGFTLGGAGAVIAGHDGEADAVIGMVARLVGSSLVRTDHRRVPVRYRMLEAVREFAAEQLRASGEEDETHIRQLDYLVGLARSVRHDEFFGPPVLEVMAALDGEHDNVREALELLLGAQDGERALLLAGAMGTYWAERGHWGEGQRWLSRALELNAASRTLDRARALTALAQTTASFAGIAGRIEELNEAIEIYREHDAHRHLIAPLIYLWLARAWRHEMDLMRDASAEVKRLAAGLESRWADTTIAIYDSLSLVQDGALEDAREGLVKGAAALVDLGDESLAARTLMYAGNVSRLIGDPAGARRELEQSMELSRAHAIHGTYAHGTLALAQIAMQLDDPNAPSLFMDCLAALELIGDTRCIAVCQRSLGSLALDANQVDEALEWLRRSLDALAAHDQRSLAVAIADLATICQRRGETADAQQLAAAAQYLAHQPGMPLTDIENARIDASTASIAAHYHRTSPPQAVDNSTIDLEALLETARHY
jgi:predicted ATPase/DNA-binding SARP family transcriptional activator